MPAECYGLLPLAIQYLLLLSNFYFWFSRPFLLSLMFYDHYSSSLSALY